MNKKVIALLGGIFIIIVGVLGFVIYSRSKNATPEATNQPAQTNNAPTTVTETPPAPESPITTESKAIRLSDEATLSPIMTYMQNGISFFDTAGKLYQTDMQISGNTVLLSNRKELGVQPKTGITKILWPAAGNYFIAEQSGGANRRWSLFDPTRNAYVDLPRQVYSIDWMPNGSQVVYIWVDDAGKSSMSIAAPDTTGYRKIIDMFQSDNFIDVSPDGKKVAFYRNQNQDPTKNVINVASIDGKQIGAVVKDGYNKGTKWSPDSRKFLFNKRDPATQRFMLWVADTVTNEVKSLGVVSSVAKASWSNDSQLVYIGEPVRGNADLGLTEDKLAVVNVNTGMKENMEVGKAVDMQDMFLSGDGSILFFRNAQDNFLYYLPLKK